MVIGVKVNNRSQSKNHAKKKTLRASNAEINVPYDITVDAAYNTHLTHRLQYSNCVCQFLQRQTCVWKKYMSAPMREVKSHRKRFENGWTCNSFLHPNTDPIIDIRETEFNKWDIKLDICALHNYWRDLRKRKGSERKKSKCYLLFQ